MERLLIDATDSTPFIDFDFDSNKLVLKGESYPENVSAFYAPVFEKLQSYIDSTKDQDVQVEVELIYFNSSSVKAVMNFLDMLEELAKNGNKVDINWYYEEDDETIMEFGEEFSEDLEYVNFNLKEI
ncbi:MAG: DUF1987 domain-containing protein [Campylobacterales bacterium]